MKKQNLLTELTEKYSSEGYEGKYLMCAVFKAAMIISVVANKMKEAEYFFLRLQQTEKEIQLAK